MLAFLGSTAILISAATSPSAPQNVSAPQPARVTARVVVPAPAQRGPDRQAVGAAPSAAAAGGRALRQQRELHVLMPALSGDGGG
jgi:hypothetical protein